MTKEYHYHRRHQGVRAVDSRNIFFVFLAESLFAHGSMYSIYDVVIAMDSDIDAEIGTGIDIDKRIGMIYTYLQT